jgi:hypothetical protein
MKFKWYAEIKADLLLLGKAGKFTNRLKGDNQSIDVLGIENGVLSTTVGAGMLYDISNSFNAHVNSNTMMSETQT